MIRVSVTELKSQLSKYLRLVKQGEVIEVVERSIPIARLESIGAKATDAVREQLVRDGVVSPAGARPSAEFLASSPVPCAGDAVRALIDERGDR